MFKRKPLRENKRGVVGLVILLVIGYLALNKPSVAPPSPAPVAGGTDEPKLHYLFNGGGKHVVVWRDAASMDEGEKLVDAREVKSHPVTMFSLVSCFADNGSKVIIEDGGPDASTVLVVRGDDDGCRGVIDNRDLVEGSPPSREKP